MLRTPVMGLAAAVAITVGFAGAAPEGNVGTSRGSVLVTSTIMPGTTERWIAVALDEGGNGGRADKLFILQTKSDAVLPDALLRDASVVFDGLQVKVLDRSGVVVLSLAAESVTRVPNTSSNSNAITGFGLSVRRNANLAMTGTSVLSYLRLAMTRSCPVAPSDCPECPPPPPCTSGGTGSVSCDIGGCSGEPTECGVQCVSGYFACCNCYPSGASCTCQVSP